MVSTIAVERGASPVEGVVASEGLLVPGGVAVSLAPPPIPTTRLRGRITGSVLG